MKKRHVLGTLTRLGETEGSDVLVNLGARELATLAGLGTLKNSG